MESKVSRVLHTILDELKSVFDHVDEEQLEVLQEAILKAPRIFVVGIGREGLSSRALAMRLMHLGKPVYWIWDDTTPAIEEGDLLIATSGSAEIPTIHHVVNRAKELGASIALITGNPNGRSAKLADITVFIPAQVWGKGSNVVRSIQPMGTLFEQAALLLYDAVVLSLLAKMGLTTKDMERRHRNVE